MQKQKFFRSKITLSFLKKMLVNVSLGITLVGVSLFYIPKLSDTIKAQGPDLWGGSLGSDIYNANAGNVGIGTNTPGAKLEIAGNGPGFLGLNITNPDGRSQLAVSGRMSDDPTQNFQPAEMMLVDQANGKMWGFLHDGTNGFSIYNHISGTPVFSHPLIVQFGAPTNSIFVHKTGNVGIGTSSPGAKLDVVTGSGGTGVALTLDPTIQPNAQNSPMIKWDSSTDSTVDKIWWARQQANDWVLVTSDPEDKDFANPKILIHAQSDGRVSVPILQITGGADLSEQFDIQSDQAGLVPSPGMVACIDVEHPGELVICNQPYDRAVAGIVSGAGDVKPGMLMGQTDSEADGRYPVALTGRVYVWADASSGPIQPGDLLTTSDISGHAMKVSDHERAQGAILGKAMSSLDEAQGLVLVLVSLQ